MLAFKNACILLMVSILLCFATWSIYCVWPEDGSVIRAETCRHYNYHSFNKLVVLDGVVVLIIFACIILAISKNAQASHFIKIRPVGAELIHSEGYRDRRK
jgi:hypothetical protein